MKIGQKIILGFVALGLLVALIGVVAIYPIHSGLEELGSFHTAARNSIQGIQAIITGGVEESFAYLLSGEKIEKEEFFQNLKKFDVEAEKFRKIANLDKPGEEEERALFESIVSHKKNLAEKAKAAFNEFEAKGYVSRETYKDYEGVVDTITPELERLVNIEKNEVEKAQILAIGAIKKSERLMYLIGALAIVISLLIGRYISTSITRPLNILGDAAEEIGRGKLDTEIEVRGGDEIGDLAISLKIMTEGLKKVAISEKLAALGRLTAGACHEILNPLNIISTRLQLMLSDERVPKEINRHLAVLAEQADRIAKITQGLVTFSRQRPPKHQQLDLNENVTHILGLIEHDLKIENIAVELRLAENLPPVSADQGQLQQVVLNMLTNACDAMPEGGRLVLSTDVIQKNGERFVEFRVEDTGIGIASEHMGRLFEPFFTTKPGGESAGLGLAICQGIIEAHGGSLWAENVPGGGAVFVIRLGVEDNE